MATHELANLLTSAPDDSGLVLEYCRRLVFGQENYWEKTFLSTIRTYETTLIPHADPVELADLLLYLPPHVSMQLPCHYYLHLGARLATAKENDLAVRVYFRVTELSPASLEAESALSRIARLMDFTMNEPAHAQWYYSELKRRFPQSQSADRARQTLEKMYQSGRAVRPTDGPAGP